MKDYGQITNITDNDLTSTGTNNLRDDANSSDSYSQYNYASISSIGIAIDGVTIYPVLNNTLTPAQEAAEGQGRGGGEEKGKPNTNIEPIAKRTVPKKNKPCGNYFIIMIFLIKFLLMTMLLKNIINLQEGR